MPALHGCPHQVLKATGAPVLGPLAIERVRYKEPTGISCCPPASAVYHIFIV